MSNSFLLLSVIGLGILFVFSVIFLLILIQVSLIFRRILLKIEIHIDTLGKDREEIKLKILNFLEDIFLKLKNLLSIGKGGESSAKKKETISE